MGSINDYLRNRSSDAAPKTGKWRNRILGQISLSLVLFLLVAGMVNADNIFGDSARYVVGTGISTESSWISFSDNSDRDNLIDTPGATLANNNADVFPADDSAPPDFTAPASGIVVTDIAVTTGGFATQQGILIQGNAGQNVKAAAGGKVTAVESSIDGYIVELEHSGGFVSVYQGLSAVEVASGDTVAISETLGATADGEITFSLSLNGTEVNPLDYLFE